MTNRVYFKGNNVDYFAYLNEVQPFMGKLHTKSKL